MQAKCPSLCFKRSLVHKSVKYGSFYRKSDRRKIQRFKCARCGVHFSQATNSPLFGQKRRDLNFEIMMHLVSGVSQRRSAFILNTQQKTVARKLSFLGLQARHKNYLHRLQYPKVHKLQFDDLETFEYTKLKPLSVTLAVEKGSRYILGFEVARMPAKGLLAKRSIKKYGYRKDERHDSRDRLFRRLQKTVSPRAVIQSDQNPHYPESVKKHFPEALHLTVKGQRGAITGQGELKAVRFDPIFSLNHTCAMKRANINRLFRKTWCTTKKIQSFIDHLEIYTYFHNHYLIA